MSEGDQLQRRRELRRRRILENSEDRLKRLMEGDRSSQKELSVHGNSTLDVDRNASSICESPCTALGNDPPNSLLSNCDQPQRSAMSLPGTSGHDLNKNHRSSNNRALGDYDTDSDDCSYSQSEGAPRAPDNSRNVQTLPKILSENKPCFKTKGDGAGRGSLTKSNNLLFLVRVILWRKWLSVLFAVTGLLTLQIFEAQTVQQMITVPVIALEVAILTFEVLTRFECQQQPQGVMAAALLLCGIRNAVGLVHLYNSIVRVLQDFALYFFVFFVCHQSLVAIG